MTNEDSHDDHTSVTYLPPTASEDGHHQALRENHNRMALMIQEASEAGLDEETLRSVVEALRVQTAPTMINLALAQCSQSTGVPKEDIHRLARGYEKERIRSTEDGPLFHYHQTSSTGFERAVNSGGLMSYNLLLEEGSAPASSGTRPDVVQMTRDRYSSSGQLRAEGLAERTLGAHGNDVVLVFNDSVMDTPGYDCISRYPQAPKVSFDHLAAALVPEESGKAAAKALLANHGYEINVMTRNEWRKAKYPAQTS